MSCCVWGMTLQRPASRHAFYLKISGGLLKGRQFHGFLFLQGWLTILSKVWVGTFLGCVAFQFRSQYDRFGRMWFLRLQLFETGNEGGMFLVPVCQTKRRHLSADRKPYRHMQSRRPRGARWCSCTVQFNFNDAANQTIIRQSIVILVNEIFVTVLSRVFN